MLKFLKRKVVRPVLEQLIGEFVEAKAKKVGGVIANELLKDQRQKVEAVEKKVTDSLGQAADAKRKVENAVETIDKLRGALGIGE